MTLRTPIVFETVGVPCLLMAPLSGLLNTMFVRLEKAYGYQGWWPLGSRAGDELHDAEGYRTSPRVMDHLAAVDRLEIAVGAILTQNTAWTNARAALGSLRAATGLDPAVLDGLPEAELAEMIRSCGYFNQKARKIKLVVRYLLDSRFERGSRLDDARVPERAELLALWGIGPETADSILLYAYGIPNFVVDAYARRILARLGAVGREPRYERLQELLHEALPRDGELYGEFHALLVRHGRAFCRPTPRCSECPLRSVCAFAGAQ